MATLIQREIKFEENQPKLKAPIKYDKWTRMIQKGELPEKKHYHLLCKKKKENKQTTQIVF